MSYIGIDVSEIIKYYRVLGEFHLSDGEFSERLFELPQFDMGYLDLPKFEYMLEFDVAAVLINFSLS